MSFVPRQHVVVPIDFSDRSFAALGVARTLVDSAAKLRIIHVLPPLSPMDPGVVWDAWNDESRREHATEALRSRIGDPELAGVQIDILIGDPAREIADKAAETEADLIVLPSHGRTGAARLLIGSVAERVVRHAHCPVLVLRE